MLVLISYIHAYSLEYTSITIYDRNTKFIFQVTTLFEKNGREKYLMFEAS